jgi:hypothetical protein
MNFANISKGLLAIFKYDFALYFGEEIWVYT